MGLGPPKDAPTFLVKILPVKEDHNAGFWVISEGLPTLVPLFLLFFGRWQLQLLKENPGSSHRSGRPGSSARLIVYGLTVARNDKLKFTTGPDEGSRAPNR
jgi:hypothetical protein